jgi:hypothetical protein
MNLQRLSHMISERLARGSELVISVRLLVAVFGVLLI